MTCVLIMDDAAHRVRWLEAQTTELGWETHCVGSDAAVLQCSVRRHWDLCLVSLSLQEGNGFERGARLRGLIRAPILIYTSHPRESDTAWAKALGLHGMLTAPDVRDAVRRALLAAVEGADDA